MNTLAEELDLLDAEISFHETHALGTIDEHYDDLRTLLEILIRLTEKG